jgi:hypothetical protein
VIWVNSISDLMYYHTPIGAPCYCEAVVYASDMVLQSRVSSQATITVNLYSPDGTTNLGDITSYFESYFFTNPINKQLYFNLRLKSFAPLMCTLACYILRVHVGSVFDKYTERYCQSSCCDVPRGITVRQTGLNDDGRLIMPVDPPVMSEPVFQRPMTACGNPLITLYSYFSCYDSFNDEYYAIPAGQTWGFMKVTNFRGSIEAIPRTISRTVSYNCQLQYVESTPLYRLKSIQEAFPIWKMREMEGQLHADNIFVNDYITDKQYQFGGGTPFERIYTCWELYKLVVQLQDCTQRQVFGCSDPCSNDGLMFSIPGNYGDGAFYSESGNLIATDFAGLIEWYRNQDGITEAYQIYPTSPLTSPLCSEYAMFYVDGEGYIPTFFYYDAVRPANRVYGVQGVDPSLLCSGEPVCEAPEVGSITFEDDGCITPTIGTITFADIIPEDVTIIDYGDWVNTSEDGSLYNNSVTFSLTTVNTTITGGSDVSFAGEIIGVMPGDAKPSSPRFYDIDDETYVAIDVYGNISYYGFGTTTGTETTITITNATYSL